MTIGLNQVFATVSARSGDAAEFSTDYRADFIWQQDRPSVMETLMSAVTNLRSFWTERSLDAGVVAARTSVDAVVNHILKGKRFNNVRDADGLDAGYYITRFCLPYDFVALGVVAQLGAVSHVEPLRYYNQHPDGHAAFFSALDAGLSFSNCVDEEGHNAGFFVARSGDEEVIARYELAGGTFRQPELDYLGRNVQVARVA